MEFSVRILYEKLIFQSENCRKSDKIIKLGYF